MSDKGSAVAEPQTQPRGRSPDSFTVELAGDKDNVDVRVSTFKETFRGRWSRANVDRTDIGEMSGMPDLPGIHFTLDLRRSKLRIFDPLEKRPDLLAAHDKVSEKVRQIKPTDSKSSAVAERIMDLSPDQMKTLVMEIGRNLGHVYRIVEGTFPSDEEIGRMPGRRLHDPGNSNARKVKYHDDAEEHYRAMDARIG